MSIFSQLQDFTAEPPRGPAASAAIDWAALSAVKQPLGQPLTQPFAQPQPQPQFQGVGALLAAPAEDAVRLAASHATLLPLAPSVQIKSPLPAPSAPADFAIFNALGTPREAPPPTPPPAPGSTLSRLKQVVSHPGQPSLPEPVSRREAQSSSARANALPAATVTVPLGEVMRLVATGGPPVTSPFDTFRAALRTPSSL